MISNEVLKWFIGRLHTFEENGITLEHLSYSLNDPSNDPKLTFDIQGKNNSFGSVSLWNTGDILFGTYQTGYKEVMYEKHQSDDLEEIKKTIVDFIYLFQMEKE